LALSHKLRNYGHIIPFLTKIFCIFFYFFALGSDDSRGQKQNKILNSKLERLAFVGWSNINVNVKADVKMIELNLLRGMKPRMGHPIPQ